MVCSPFFFNLPSWLPQSQSGPLTTLAPGKLPLASSFTLSFLFCTFTLRAEKQFNNHFYLSEERLYIADSFRSKAYYRGCKRHSTFTGPKYLCSLPLGNWQYFYWTDSFFTSHGTRTGVFSIEWHHMLFWSNAHITALILFTCHICIEVNHFSYKVLRFDK